MGAGAAHYHILVGCMLLAAILEFLRGFNTKNVFSGLESPTVEWPTPSPA
ncbi:C4-dicarboxylate transporter DcuC [Klebsiella pneumoniae]|uniref:C4-dicarboxylate transporter DcuC n=1 Tax=Klebsiella pneumoniae TaxID=573 RepID=A0A2X3EWR5_KLEPN|nr:C4-dicarboxylate transporter DcuC [Klebsiella pneumoniae]